MIGKHYIISSYSFASDKICECIRILAISDIHNNFSQEWIDAIKEVAPDYVFILGDLVTGKLLKGNESEVLWRSYNPYAYKSLCELKNVAPVYFALGNHEVYMTLRDISDIVSMGITVLDDDYIFLKEGIVLGGLTSGLVTGYRKYMKSNSQEEKIRGSLDYDFYHHGEADFELTKPNFKWIDLFEKEEGYKLLLSHHPEYWAIREPMLNNRNIDLVLSGHAHGGQIRVLDRGIYAPGQGLLPKYTKGKYRGKHGDMVVTSGMANTYKIPRLFNPYEILKIVIEPS